MTIIKNTLLLLIIMSTFACSDMKTKNSNTYKEGMKLASIDPAPKSISPDSAIIAFLKWYKDNDERLHKIQLITGGLDDTTTFYSVDFKATERYLSELKKSGFLSEGFLNELRKHFTQSNEYLKKHPQNDGPAPGFEADLIMKSQDYMDVWENLDKVKVINEKTSSDKAFVELLFAGNYKTKYFLTKKGNKWLIDTIDNAFSES